MRRGEVYFIDLNPVLGREQRGRRPVVVVSCDVVNRMPLVVTVVPGTSSGKPRPDFPGNVRVPAGEASLPNETLFLTFQVRSVDHNRFLDPPVGQLGPEWMQKIEQALLWTFDLRHSPTAPP